MIITNEYYTSILIGAILLARSNTCTYKYENKMFLHKIFPPSAGFTELPG